MTEKSDIKEMKTLTANSFLTCNDYCYLVGDKNILEFGTFKSIKI